MEKLGSVMCPESMMWIIVNITRSYSLSSSLNVMTNPAAAVHSIMTVFMKDNVLEVIFLLCYSQCYKKINSSIFVRSSYNKNIEFGQNTSS